MGMERIDRRACGTRVRVPSGYIHHARLLCIASASPKNPMHDASMTPVQSRWTNGAKRIKILMIMYVSLLSTGYLNRIQHTIFRLDGFLNPARSGCTVRGQCGGLWYYLYQSIDMYVSLLRPDAAPLPNVEPLS